VQPAKGFTIAVERRIIGRVRYPTWRWAATNPKELIGKAEELSALTGFIEALAEGPRAFLVEGEAGIGKTTVWQAGLQLAAQAGRRALWCRPTGSEAAFSYAALGDLLQGEPAERLPRLPEPQRRALEQALVLSEAGDDPAGARAVALGFLGVLRSFAEEGPVLVAVDDTQWLDGPTAGVLEFAARRLRDEPVGLLLARRSTEDELPPLGLARAFPEERAPRIRLGPLSLAELHELLFGRLGLDLPRPTLRRLREASGGNPFFALEIGRALVRSGSDPVPGGALPVPETLRELVRGRLAPLPARTREALLAASALSQPTLALVAAALPRGRSASSALARATDADVIELDHDRIRFTHPLLASTIYADVSPVRRRRLHRRLAAAVADPEEKARHLAFAAEGPDAEVASALDHAGLAARARGATDVAALLTVQARQLTPPTQSADLWRRTMKAIEYTYEAGDSTRALQLGQEAVALSPGSRDRANALNILARVSLYDDLALSVRLWEEALAEAGIDLPTRAASQHGLAVAGWMRHTDLTAAAAHARAAVAAAEGVDSVALARALMLQAWIDGMRAEPGALALMERAVELEGDTRHSHVLRQASHHMGFFLAWADRLEEWRASLEQLYEQAVSGGDESSIPTLRSERRFAEMLLGNWAEAKRLQEEAAGQSTDRIWDLAAEAELSALLGLVDGAREAGERAVALGDDGGQNWPRIEALGTLGFLELSLGHPAEAHEHLARAVSGAEAAGIREPSACGYVLDDIEALIALARLDEAIALLEPLEERALALDRPTARGRCGRCRGLLLAARGDLLGALAALEAALEQHERVSRPFELARSLLALGTIQRRAKRKAAARATLERALATFDRLGARLWAETTQAELARIGGRAPSRWELTPTEEHVATLVAAGHTNKEVAAALFMSVRTVDWNLRKIYGKLGIHSRRELAARAHPPTGP
jgi:DNA-binding CsgD family transcriptional regulator